MTTFDPDVTHKVIKTEVVRQDNGLYAVNEFDDGFTDEAEAGEHPLLLNAAKANALRQRSKKD